jgi:5-methylcytosine-specific restriction endonuclease McrBC regulatory subunit McrC
MEELIVGRIGTRVPLPVDKVTPAMLRRIRRLVRAEPLPDGSGFELRRRSPLIGGRVRFGTTTLTIRTDVDSMLVLRMLLYGLNGDLSSVDGIVGSSSERADAADDLERLIALAFVATTEQSLQRSPKREYRRIVEERTALAGRPLWARAFGRPLSLAVPCEIHLLESNTLVQRLLLAASGMAVTLLSATRAASRARRILGLLETLATPHVATHRDVDEALRMLAGANQHFRVPLLLARALLFGEAPTDPLESGTDAFPGIVYDVPSIFERAVKRFLDRTLARYELQARYQRSNRATLFDAAGRRYKVSRPDIELYHRSRCVAVVDCKYKPRYISRKKLTSADIYQVLFYGETAPRRTRDQEVALAIIAPQMPGPVLPEAARTVIAERARGRSVIRVLPIDMVRLLDAARADDEVSYLRSNRELHDFFSTLRRTRVPTAIGHPFERSG